MNRRKHNRLKWAVILFLLLPFSSLKAETTAETKIKHLEMEALVEEAIANSPAIASARRSAQAARLRVKPSGTLPDPTLMLGLQAVPIDTFAMDEWDMTQKVISFTQPIPFPGKLRLAKAVAKSGEKAAVRQTRIIEDRLAFEVRRTFLKWDLSKEAVRITRANLKIIDQFIKVATAKYSVGKGAQWDILRAQVEHSKLSERLATLKQNIESLKANMARLLGRKDNRVEGTVNVKWTPVMPLTERDLFQRAVRSNSTLAHMRSLVDKARNSARLAKKRKLPDFSITITYGIREDGEMAGMPRERPDFISGMVGIKLPIYSRRKQTPLARAAERQAFSVRSRLEDEKLRIRAEIQDRLLRIRRAETVGKLYRTGILPQSRTTVRSAMASYQVNKVDFLSLLTSELTLMNHELDYYRIKIDRETDLAALTLLIGENVKKIRNINPLPLPPGVRKGGEENETQ